MFDLRCQVKQYVAEVDGEFCSFRVFMTGDPKYYLFCQIHNEADTGLQFPVEKKRLRNDIRSALSHGWRYKREKTG